jgi:hypothetical protein
MKQCITCGDYCEPIEMGYDGMCIFCLSNNDEWDPHEALLSNIEHDYRIAVEKIQFALARCTTSVGGT